MTMFLYWHNSNSIGFELYCSMFIICLIIQLEFLQFLQSELKNMSPTPHAWLYKNEY